MEPVTTHHPVTSLSEIFILLGWTGVATLIWYAVMGTPHLLIREAVASMLNRRPTEADMQAVQVSTDQISGLRKFHFSWPTFLLNCVPMLMIVLVGVACSLLRDAGYLIFPWAMGLGGVACGVALNVVYSRRRRLIRRLMVGKAA